MNKANPTNQQKASSGEAGGSYSGTGVDDPAVEPPDVFCSLGSLIVEGRIPAGEGEGGGRGYYEGPHVELPGRISRHKCEDVQYLCNKNENFRKHMLLLWQNNVPMSVEVLLCSDCRVGQQKARSVEVTTVPEPGSILLEQWTVAVFSSPRGSGQMNSLALMQAVRSYLHFSQLSAWYSKTSGASPRNVLIRITIPGEEFSSKFTRPPEEHFFPTADVGYKSAISVSVRSLPRSSEIPKVMCSHNQPLTPAAEDEEDKLEVAGALAWRDPTDLRRSLVKSKLALSDLLPSSPDCPGRLSKSDSMDSMLGDSLLDPPQSRPPRRYQSPSRCGSPSLEAPDHLLGGRRDSGHGRVQLPTYEQAMGLKLESPTSPDARLNRHDLLRRRDLSLFHGLHPRLLHGHPRLSLPPRTPTATPRPSAAAGSEECTTPQIVDDRMQVKCNISGKHICQIEEDTEEHKHQPSGSQFPISHVFREQYQQAELGAKPRGWTSRVSRTPTPYSRDQSSDESQSDLTRPPLCKSTKDAQLNTSPESNSLGSDEIDDVLQVLRSRNSPILSQSKERRPSTKDDVFDDLLNLHSKSRRSSLEEMNDCMRLTPQVTQVYHAEVASSPPNLDKADILLGAILRNCQHRSKSPPVIHPVQTNLCNNYSSVASNSNSSSSSETSPSSPPYCQFYTPILENITNKPNQATAWCYSSQGEDCRDQPPTDSQLGQLCHDLERKCLISQNNEKEHIQNKENTSRGRSFSENALSNGLFQLDPLDLSFEEFDENSFFTTGSQENLHNYSQSDRRDSLRDDEAIDGVPSATKMAAFRKSLDSATSMVFHHHTGLPLTSSPAPMRRGIKFDFDARINTPKDIKRALFEAQSAESELESPKKRRRNSRKLLSTSAPATITSNNLLGNFEESVLNGRLEPVSTVEGFTAEIGASGTFHPKHLTFPVTVFFYTLCDNSNMASPYLGHINLGKKGYRVPEKGTIQVTLFNPLGTVVKMFVVMYDLQDMPPSSQTFIRQRTLYMPSDATDNHPGSQKWLRYLIHLRFASSKSGKIYLHTDVRMIIFRKSDVDTATDHETGKGFELRSFTHGPSNPKFSPRK